MEQTAAQACPVCGNPADLYDVVGFDKSCREAEGVRLALAGVPIHYRRCGACKHMSQLFSKERERIRHLDYGDGTTAESLGKFKLITSFEGFEHVAERHGLNFRSFSPNTHCFYNARPAWAGLAGT